MTDVLQVFPALDIRAAGEMVLGVPQVHRRATGDKQGTKDYQFLYHLHHFNLSFI